MPRAPGGAGKHPARPAPTRNSGWWIRWLTLSPPAVAGVLLVREDVELMSTALNYFAAALKDGADLVLSDAVFGYNGATALYQSDAHISCTGCALVSRALLDRCRAAAKDPESVSELLDAVRPPERAVHPRPTGSAPF